MKNLTEASNLSTEEIADALAVNGRMLMLIRAAFPDENEHKIFDLCKTYLRMVNDASKKIEQAKKQRNAAKAEYVKLTQTK